MSEKKATRQPGTKATRVRNRQSSIVDRQSPEPGRARDKLLAELLGFDAQRIRQFFGFTRIRGGLGAHRFRDATEAVADMVERRARALGIPTLRWPARRPSQVDRVPAPSAARALDEKQAEIEAARRAAVLIGPEEEVEVLAYITPEERIQANRRRKSLGLGPLPEPQVAPEVEPAVPGEPR